MPYYKGLDILKFAACIGVVSVHTGLFVDCGAFYNTFFLRFQTLLVPMFFMASSCLLWPKVHFDNSDGPVLRRYITRLALLYLLFTLAYLPFWLPDVLADSRWVVLLAKKLLTGTAWGSYFFPCLIFGTLAVYLLNRLIGYRWAFIVICVLFLYHGLVHYDGMTDVLGIFMPNAYYLPQRGMFWVETGLALSLMVRRHPVKTWAYGTLPALTATAIAALVGMALVESFIWLPTFCIAVILICLACQTEQSQNLFWPTLRRMSVMIYISHFAICYLGGYLFEQGYIDTLHGPALFCAAMAFSLAISWAAVRLSMRYPPLKWLC